MDIGQALVSLLDFCLKQGFTGGKEALDTEVLAEMCTTNGGYPAVSVAWRLRGGLAYGGASTLSPKSSQRLRA